ncbi:efflux RND transporter permease subunit [Halopseudomonas pachastrellae]|nr:efflux RND transporter permease subunit [Halopseudomonas pachastrellae]
MALPIFQSPGSNALDVSAAVRGKMAELAEDFPEGLSWEVAYDPTVFVSTSISSVITTLLEAVVLVVLVVILFLQTWRASLIPLLAVPVSIVGSFAVLLMLGFSINTLTLFAMVLAIGIVVDDAIVVVETSSAISSRGWRHWRRRIRRCARSAARLWRSVWCSAQCSYLWRFWMALPASSTASSR